MKLTEAGGTRHGVRSLVKLVSYCPANIYSVGQSSEFGTFAFYLPRIAFFFDGHLITGSPPAIDLRGTGAPEAAFLTNFLNMLQQAFIDGPWFLLNHIVGMND